MFVVFTGLDGSGTSTLAQAVAKDNLLINTPGPYYKDRESVDGEVRTISPLAHYYYYLSSVIFASDTARKHSGDVFCVRYAIDTVVSHRVMGLNVDLEMVYNTTGILKPDYTFFIHVEEKTRQDRISARNYKSNLDRVLDDDSTRAKFLENFSVYEDQFIRIDNSGHLENSVKKIMDVIYG